MVNKMKIKEIHNQVVCSTELLKHSRYRYDIETQLAENLWLEVLKEAEKSFINNSSVIISPIKTDETAYGEPNGYTVVHKTVRLLESNKTIDELNAEMNVVTVYEHNKNAIMIGILSRIWGHIRKKLY
jgi:hypothetical protein